MDSLDTRADTLARVESAMAVVRPLYERLVQFVGEALDLKDTLLALRLIREWSRESGEEATRVVLMLALLDLAEQRRKP